MRINIDQGDFIKTKAMLAGVKNGASRVMARSVNKTLTNVRTKAVQEIGKELNLTATRIRKDFTFEKANYVKPSGAVIAKGKPVGLASFKGTRQTQKGVSVKVKTNGRRKIIKHAFIATARNARNVFWREYEGPRKPVSQKMSYGRLPKSYRHPIHRLTGPRIQDIYAEPKIMNVVQAYAGERLTHNMNHELDYELKRL